MKKMSKSNTSLTREKELFDERAGILEFDAGMTKEEAEKQAEIEINNERNENE